MGFVLFFHRRLIMIAAVDGTVAQKRDTHVVGSELEYVGK